MRNAFKYLTLSVLGISTAFGVASIVEQSFAAPESQEWSYEGADGPEAWGGISEEFEACALGTQQSPIDLQNGDAIDAELTELEFNYQPSALNVLNNGHTIQVNYSPGSTLTLDDQTYELLQFHFHDPSEHTVDGSSYPMEVHFVHQNAETGALAVVGVLLDIGADDNVTLQPIWDHIPSEAGPAVDVDGVDVNAAELLPDTTQENYRYFGSLTTPPCSETVNWIVMKETVTVSFQQVEQFAAAVGENARPIQTLGRRFVLD
ncbi:MAG: carbonic anhydrase family protein [Cyanobacteria bacterium P01_A01_bin.3]